jgi:hypothetical protein
MDPWADDLDVDDHYASIEIVIELEVLDWDEGFAPHEQAFFEEGDRLALGSEDEAAA